MDEEVTAYLLDAGNTQVKLGEVKNGVISNVKRFDINSFPWETLQGNIPVLISSVLSDEWKRSLEDFFQHLVYISVHMKLPFQLAYQTPETLGIDRLCNVGGIALKNQGVPRLIVDLGTCIKFDFLGANQMYEGGSISPGLNMRAKALNAFTAKLPLVPLSVSSKLTGKSTQESIESGVFHGWVAEITQMIQYYQTQFPDLVVFLTGGDSQYFDFDQKSNIFVLEHITLEGILEIYHLNEDSL
jgi:type III pantothenate kinase